MSTADLPVQPTTGVAARGSTPRISYIPALDGLRGLAVIAVVAFHVGHLEGGYLGVDLFFVLSGFLITSLLLAEGEATEHIKLARFWGRRARRLLPALGVTLLGVAAYARFAARPAELHRIRWDGVATLLYVANWREVFNKVDYWSMFSAPSPLNHTWSLAIEEQFYLVWPLVFAVLVLLARRRGPSQRRLATGALITSLVLGAASLAATAVLEHFDGWNRAYFGTDTRAFAILAGAAIAAATVRFGAVREGWPRRVLEVAGLLGVVVLAVAWLHFAGGAPAVRHGGLAACSLGAAFVIAAASHPKRGPIAIVLSWTPLRWIGLISYGVYLYHWPLIVWLNADRVHLNGWPLIGVQIVATLAIATVSYFAVEQPIRRGRRWHRRANIVVPAFGFAAVALVVFAGTIGYQPLDAPQVAGPGTTVAPAPDGPRIMVVGDSVPYLLAKEGITYLKSDPQFDLLNLAVPACSEPPTKLIRYTDGTISSAFTGDCNHHWESKSRDFKPDYVIYTTAGAAGAEYRHAGQWLRPCSSAYHDWVIERIETLAAMFDHDDATFVLVTTVPQGRRGRSDAAYQRYLDADACWNAALRDAAGTSQMPIKLIDLDKTLCSDDASCRSHTKDGSIVRQDGIHFRGHAAQIIGKLLLGQLGIATTIPG